MVRLSHPDLDDREVEVPEGAARSLRRRGWVDVAADIEPLPAAEPVPEGDDDQPPYEED